MTARINNVLIEPHSATVWCGFLLGSAFGKYSGILQLPVLNPSRSNLDAHLLCFSAQEQRDGVEFKLVRSARTPPLTSAGLPHSGCGMP